MSRDAFSQWSDAQRALARTMGLSLEEWLSELDAAGKRAAPLMAAAIGAAVARGMGPGAVRGLKGTEVAKSARLLIDPTPPRAEHPVLREAIRRAAEISSGVGAQRLKQRESIAAPTRGNVTIGPSARGATPDAPGDED